ncbi:hypothetical protein BT69DRAFT_1298155 [Atractiella rhizophila]|nr:hypothetical protein BT69DRAFT_1298155 [Atractiella rhizophila]
MNNIDPSSGPVKSKAGEGGKAHKPHSEQAAKVQCLPHLSCISRTNEVVETSGSSSYQSGNWQDAVRSSKFKSSYWNQWEKQTAKERKKNMKNKVMNDMGLETDKPFPGFRSTVYPIKDQKEKKLEDLLEGEPFDLFGHPVKGTHSIMKGLHSATDSQLVWAEHQCRFLCDSIQEAIVYGLLNYQGEYNPPAGTDAVKSPHDGLGRDLPPEVERDSTVNRIAMLLEDKHDWIDPLKRRGEDTIKYATLLKEKAKIALTSYTFPPFLRDTLVFAEDEQMKNLPSLFIVPYNLMNQWRTEIENKMDPFHLWYLIYGNDVHFLHKSHKNLLERMRRTSPA